MPKNSHEKGAVETRKTYFLQTDSECTPWPRELKIEARMDSAICFLPLLVENKIASRCGDQKPKKRPHRMRQQLSTAIRPSPSPNNQIRAVTKVGHHFLGRIRKEEKSASLFSK
jgi:hypothetical protein